MSIRGAETGGDPLSPTSQPHRIGSVEPSEEHLRSTIRKLRASASLVPAGEREDLVQEAIARALRQGVSPDALPYLRTIVRNLAIDRARKIREIPLGAPVEVDDLTPDGGHDPEGTVVSAEACEEIRRALDELPPRYREVLLAFVEEGRPARLSDRLGLSPNATWTLLSRARQRLRTQLEGAGIVPGVVALPLWRLRLKLKELVAAGTAGAVATGAALTMIVTTPTPGPVTTPEETVRPGAAVARAAEETPEPVEETPVPASTEPETEAPAPQAAAPVPTPQTTFEQTAHVCTPEEAGDREGSGGLRFEDDPTDDTISDVLVEAVPESLQRGREETGDCDR